MQGIPASGKSTMARTIKMQFDDEQPKSCDWNSVILSTDDFWTRADGSYGYDPAQVSEAHRWNQRRTVTAMQAGTNLIVIDNTNIQKWQAQVYFNLASAYGYSVQVVSVSCGLDEAVNRNKRRSFDRRIPEDILRRMHGELEPLL